ncbi:sugar phosphate isomerase/epimerase family protein [Paenibacillus soyae]|uniref:Sugar phosphate isomerase/epimerase n=1 Tax=Paenibacillus soyae TaxID=2969249 RepID=A0A9X2MRP5_9BACL|nr:sugar phosphate isomerase/epimerase [Paenibacillus soyae]MCR2805614.1 sugar phosphate isomerase/epimerase [Paenibacillus soyae]
MKTFPIGVQPYTVRDALRSDYEGTLRRLAEIGYKGIELGRPPEGVTVAEQKALLKSLGLHVVSSHAGFDTLSFDAESIMDYLDEAEGGRHIAISLRFADKDDVLRKAAECNRIGARMQERGFQFLYHNHDWEFVSYDGKYAMDWFLEATDPACVGMELDTYWAAKADVSPADYLRTRLIGRCPLLHIKDMEAGEQRFFAEVGEGVLDFVSIAAAAEEAGVEWLIVEQDESRRDPFESLAISYRNLAAMGLLQR